MCCGVLCSCIGWQHPRSPGAATGSLTAAPASDGLDPEAAVLVGHLPPRLSSCPRRTHARAGSARPGSPRCTWCGSGRCPSRRRPPRRVVDVRGSLNPKSSVTALPARHAGPVLPASVGPPTDGATLLTVTVLVAVLPAAPSRVGRLCGDVRRRRRHRRVQPVGELAVEAAPGVRADRVGDGPERSAADRGRLVVVAGVGDRVRVAVRRDGALVDARVTGP